MIANVEMNLFFAYQTFQSQFLDKFRGITILKILRELIFAVRPFRGKKGIQFRAWNKNRKNQFLRKLVPLRYLSSNKIFFILSITKNKNSDFSKFEEHESQEQRHFQFYCLVSPFLLYFVIMSFSIVYISDNLHRRNFFLFCKKVKVAYSVLFRKIQSRKLHGEYVLFITGSLAAYPVISGRMSNW